MITSAPEAAMDVAPSPSSSLENGRIARSDCMISIHIDITSFRQSLEEILRRNGWKVMDGTEQAAQQPKKGIQHMSLIYQEWKQPLSSDRAEAILQKTQGATRLLMTKHGSLPSTIISEMAALHAAGVIDDDASLQDIEKALQALAKEKYYIWTPLTSQICEGISLLPREMTDAIKQPANLRDREVEILSYMEKGWQNKRIAKKLNLSVCTIKNHVHNILKKLGVRTRVKAVEKWHELRNGNGNGQS